MGKFDFEDEDFSQGNEPTFSLYDFKNWLSKQNKANKEDIKNEVKKVRNEEEEKAEFKERVKKRRKKKEE